MKNILSILNIAFYRFVELKDLSSLKQILLTKCKELEIKGTILISSEGINAYLAGTVPNIRKFQEFLDYSPDLKGLEFKESYSEFVPSKKMMVKIKKEIIPTGNATVQPQNFTVPRIAPKDLKKWLDENREFELLDTRNDYEIEHGTFQRATHLNIQHFRDFAQKVSELTDDIKARPLVMFCTGGIRCEKAGVLAVQNGFREVYQLDGGILRYFEECGADHYQGNCFVFDDRVSLNPQNLEPVSKSPCGRPLP